LILFTCCLLKLQPPLGMSAFEMQCIVRRVVVVYKRYRGVLTSLCKELLPRSHNTCKCSGHTRAVHWQHVCCLTARQLSLMQAPAVAGAAAVGASGCGGVAASAWLTCWSLLLGQPSTLLGCTPCWTGEGLLAARM
jgi:hypothetical protein